MNDTATVAKPKPTPGPWDFCILDKRLTDIGAYVQGCTDASPGKDYFFVSGQHDDGGQADICHVGNGPRSEANARLIAAAPELLDVARTLVEIQNGKCLFDVLNPCTLGKEPGKHWGSTPENPVEACAVCKAKVAIAKAEGR